jgi:hypothetical protein
MTTGCGNSGCVPGLQETDMKHRVHLKLESWRQFQPVCNRADNMLYWEGAQILGSKLEYFQPQYDKHRYVHSASGRAFKPEPVCAHGQSFTTTSHAQYAHMGLNVWDGWWELCWYCCQRVWLKLCLCLLSKPSVTVMDSLRCRRGSFKSDCRALKTLQGTYAVAAVVSV